MNTLATNISQQDTLLATVTQYGQMIAEFQLTGFVAIADIIKVLRMRINMNRGLAVFKIRNKTQGWVRQVPVNMSQTVQVA